MDTYICPVCREPLMWDSDCEAEEIGYTIEGIVAFCHCNNCKSFVEILTPSDKNEEE